MVSHFGDFDTTETVVIPFNTFSSDDPSASVTITNLLAADVKIHKDGGTTQRTSASGVTVSIDFDTITGNHIVSIDLSDNTDAGFYADGSRYQVRMEGTTVDGATVNAWIGSFSVGCTLRPTTDGRTLDVTATGAAGIDWGNVENQSTSVNLSATTTNLVNTTTTNTDMLTAAAVNAECDTALSDYGALKPTTAGRTLDVGTTGEAGIDLNNSVGTFSNGAFAFVDSATGFIAGVNGDALKTTTVTGLSSQTVFNLSDGSTADDAYNGCLIVIEDTADPDEICVGVIDDYVGATKTVTLLEDPGVFTIANGDHVYIRASRSIKPTTAADYHLDISSGGNAGIDWANVENQSTSVNLSSTTTNLVNTTTTNTDMRGTDSAALATTIGTPTDTDIATDISNVASSIGTITNVGSATNKGASSYVLTTGAQSSGTVSSTSALDGTNHEHTDTAGAMDLYYEFAIGSGSPTSVTVTGYLNSINDDLEVYGYDWVATSWIRIGTLNGKTATTNDVNNYDLFVTMVGTGSDKGKVRIRFTDGAFTLTTATLAIDQIFVSYAAGSEGYDNGAVWLDTTVTNTETTVGIDGVSTNPVSTIAAAKTLLTSTKLHKIHIGPASTFTLTDNSDDIVFEGHEWTIALGGQSVAASMFIDASVSGTGTGAESEWMDCIFGITSLPAMQAYNCSFAATTSSGFTMSTTGDYRFINCQSGVAGSGSPLFTKTAGQTITAEFRRWSGGIQVNGIESGDVMTIGGEMGTITLGGADGEVQIRGTYKAIVDNRTGSPTLNVDGAILASDVAAILVDTNELQTDDVPGLITALNNFDPALDVVANVTLVDTTTTNTDMRGTDSALLASSAPTNFGDLAITLTTGLVSVNEDGSSFTAIPWNASWDTEVQSECTDALNAYDPPTKTELDSAFTEIKGATWASGTDTLEHIRNKQTDIETDTQDLQTQVGTAGAGLTDLGGMSTGMKAEVESEANDALVALQLDHLLHVADAGTTTNNSIVAKMVSKSATAAFSSFVNTTDSLEALADAGGGDATAANQTTIINAIGTMTDLGGGADIANNLADMAGATFSTTTDSQEAIRDRGDAAWTTGGGGSISDILDVYPLLPTSVDLADTATVRLGLQLRNSLDDLPTTGEITPGTISIDRKAIGGTSWSAVVTDAACSEAAGLIYYDEVFDSGTGYAEGDSIRVTFKSQKITVSANDYEITGASGVIYQTEIRQTMRGTDSAYTGTPPTAVAIRTEIDSNSTQLAAIVADTNELQGDWVNGGRLDLILDARASQTSVDTVDSNVDAILVDTGTTLPATLTTIEGKIDTVDSVADAILVDTGTTLPASIATVDANVDSILVDTGTTLPATLTTIEGKVDTVDTNVDAVLVDTGTTLPASLATIDSNVDAILVDTGTTLPAAIPSVSDILTTAMTESYGTDGSAVTLAQACYVIMQGINEFAISGTTKTVKQLDGSTTAYTSTLDDGTNPTSITRAT